jgi:hypothetical protein
MMRGNNVAAGFTDTHSIPSKTFVWKTKVLQTKAIQTAKNLQRLDSRNIARCLAPSLTPHSATNSTSGEETVIIMPSISGVENNQPSKFVNALCRDGIAAARRKRSRRRSTVARGRT